MKSFGDVIDKLGGSAALARAINERDGTIRQWRQRDSIPPEYWSRIVSFAKKQEKDKVTIEALADLASRRRAA
jgi:hypothetical protein